jgi:hypothetical protein
MYNRGYPFYTFSGVQKPEKIFSAFLLKGSKKCKYEEKKFCLQKSQNWYKNKVNFMLIWVQTNVPTEVFSKKCAHLQFFQLLHLFPRFLALTTQYFDFYTSTDVFNPANVQFRNLKPANVQ